MHLNGAGDFRKAATLMSLNWRIVEGV